MNWFVRKEMSIKDHNDSTMSRALIARLRSATVLKYMVYVKEDITYPGLIAEIHCHIQAEKILIWRLVSLVKASFSEESA